MWAEQMHRPARRNNEPDAVSVAYGHYRIRGLGIEMCYSFKYCFDRCLRIEKLRLDLWIHFTEWRPVNDVRHGRGQTDSLTEKGIIAVALQDHYRTRVDDEGQHCRHDLKPARHRGVAERSPIKRRRAPHFYPIKFARRC